MPFSELLLLIAVLTVAVTIYRKVQTRRLSSVLDEHLKTRQLEIQALIDDLGAELKRESTTLADGDAAARRALDHLRGLNLDHSLDPLIADTELFIEEWRATRRPA